MNRLLILMLTLCSCVTLTSCMGSEVGETIDSEKSADSKESQGKDELIDRERTETFKVGDYSVWVTTPEGWEECAADNFDVQCRSPQKDMYLSVYGYSKMDLAEDESVEGLFEAQNDAILSLRDNVSQIETISTVENEEKVISSTLYSAENDGLKNYYHFFFIRFKNTDDMAWILFTGMPSVVEKNKENNHDIISKIQNSDPWKEV